MIVSSTLCSIPFLSNTDGNRIQMASKQIQQTCISKNCKRPYVISNDWEYLSKTTSLFRYEAESDGYIAYRNNEIIILIINNNVKVFDIPEYQSFYMNFSSKLFYVREEYEFKKGDIIFEYEGFIEGVPAFGYNLNTMYHTFFGFTYEDAIVISEKVAKECLIQKTETVIMPIYTYSLMKEIYPESKYKFFPEVGQKVVNSTLSILCNNADNYNNFKISNLNVDSISSYLDSDDVNLGNDLIITKVKNSYVYDIIIHKVSNKNLIDKKLKNTLEHIYSEYKSKVKDIYKDLNNIFQNNTEFIKNIMAEKYLLTNTKQLMFSNNDLSYIIEIKVKAEYESKIGDKFTNRYANKGVVSLIIPNELRPIDSNGKPIDIIMGSLSAFNRMNFGQLIEGMISKCIEFCEEEILNDNSKTPEMLIKLSKLAKIFSMDEYSNKILNLSNDIKNDDNLLNEFVNSIKLGGMYFELPSFSNVELPVLKEFCDKEFSKSTNEKITIKKELIDFINKKENMDFPIPDEDIILNDITAFPIYTTRLSKLAEFQQNIRDIGEYSSGTKQPVKDRYGQGKSSRIGQMEFEGFISHGCENCIKEIRTVKSDALQMKSDFISQILNTGHYNIKGTTPSITFTKMLIDSAMAFMNEN